MEKYILIWTSDRETHTENFDTLELAQETMRKQFEKCLTSNDYDDDYDDNSAKINEMSAYINDAPFTHMNHDWTIAKIESDDAMYEMFIDLTDHNNTTDCIYGKVISKTTITKALVSKFEKALKAFENYGDEEDAELNDRAQIARNKEVYSVENALNFACAECDFQYKYAEPFTFSRDLWFS